MLLTSKNSPNLITARRFLASCAVACLCLSLASCARSGGRSFLATRTSIDSDMPVCAAGVVDHSECRPGAYGGQEWIREPSFPPFSISSFAVRRGIGNVMAEVRAHYLASPYYDGDIHSFCKQGLDLDLFPPDNTNLQEYKLAKVIDDRAVQPLENRLRQLLEASEARDTDGITRRFHNYLMEEVHDRVHANLLWFVTRYPGGLQDIMRNSRLRRCLQEVRGNEGAEIVTGVAGYIVLDNRIDNEIASEGVLYRALDKAMQGRYRDLLIDTDYRRAMGFEWNQKVTDVATIKMMRHDINAVAWPLWVQFE